MISAISKFQKSARATKMFKSTSSFENFKSQLILIESELEDSKKNKHLQEGEFNEAI